MASQGFFTSLGVRYVPLFVIRIWAIKRWLCIHLRLARANELALHRLDSHTCIQIVLACELVEPRGPPWV